MLHQPDPHALYRLPDDVQALWRGYALGKLTGAFERGHGASEALEGEAALAFIAANRERVDDGLEPLTVQQWRTGEVA